MHIIRVNMLSKFVVERNIRLTHNFQTKRDQKIARSFDVFDEKIILAFVFFSYNLGTQSIFDRSSQSIVSSVKSFIFYSVTSKSPSSGEQSEILT